jgi:hypothetical protein
VEGLGHRRFFSRMMEIVQSYEIGFPRRDNKKKIDYSARNIIQHLETSHGARAMTFACNSAQASPSPTYSIGGPACANLCRLPEAPIDLRGERVRNACALL